MADEVQEVKIEMLLKEFILKRYRSQTAFAKEIGVPNSTIDTILGKKKDSDDEGDKKRASKGIMGASFTNITKIARGLGLSLDGLAEGKLIPYGKSETEFSDEEWEMITKYRNLDERGQENVKHTLDHEHERAKPFGEDYQHVTGHG